MKLIRRRHLGDTNPSCNSHPLGTSHLFSLPLLVPVLYFGLAIPMHANEILQEHAFLCG